MATTKSGKNLENKPMGGCMAGLFNFSHFLSGKRCNLKRLPPPLVSASSDDTVECASLPKQSDDEVRLQNSPEAELRSPDLVSTPAPKSPLSTMEFKEAVKSPWKFSREAPRLSLDSRAVVDAKGGLRRREIRINSGAGNEAVSENQRRSPCVIARLMGLEQPPNSCSDVENSSELRRSASESRSREYRFLDSSPSFLSPVACKNEAVVERKWDQSRSSATKNNAVKSSNPRMKQNQNQISNERRLMAERRSHYNTADFFPPEKQHQQQEAVTICGEIERRLRMRGIDEPSKDLETLKHILEALQLKGLLHSPIANVTATAAATSPRRNLVFDRQSPVTPANRRRVNVSVSEPSVSPRRERPARSPGRSSSPPVRRKAGALPLSLETPRRSGGQSPRTTRRSDQNQTVNRSPRGSRSTVEITRGPTQRFSRRGPGLAYDEAEASTVSESSLGTENEEMKKWISEECRDGRGLLERCDKLLHSIAKMNSNSVELQQPSPVSVLDSSFYKDEEESPSPVKKRSIHFKEMEDELWSPSSSSLSSSSSSSRTTHDHHHLISDDPDFIYISEVYRAFNYIPDEPDLFLLLEKQISKHNSKPSFSQRQRKLIFDTVLEILDWARRLPPWRSVPGGLSLNGLWAEFKRVQYSGPANDLFEVVIGVLKKDLGLAQDGVNGWGDHPVEISEAVLDIERLIFKDLIGEAIQHLAVNNVGAQKHCRKLVF